MCLSRVFFVIVSIVDCLKRIPDLNSDEILHLTLNSDTFSRCRGDGSP